MFFNSYATTKHQKKDLIDSFYQKIIDVSRNKVFYSKLIVPDTMDGRYDLLVLFSIRGPLFLYIGPARIAQQLYGFQQYPEPTKRKALVHALKAL